MKFYAVGLTRAGVEEVRVGPFASMKEAKAAGERKAKESNGDFVFEAVMDEAGHQVFKVEPLLTANSIRSTNRIVQNALNVMAKNVRAESIIEDLKTSIEAADDDIEDGDLKEARRNLKEIRGRAFYYGLEKEWRKVASKVGLNAEGVARNAAFQVDKAKDGNRLNDFIKFSYVDADEKVKSGEIPYVRKDMLRGYIERDVARLKNRLSVLEKHLKELDNL